MKSITGIKWFKHITNFLVTICLLLGIAFTVYGFMHIGNESDGTIVTYAIAFVSFLISVVALVVSLRTYFSIDAVNSITSMEGNILQNESYTVSYPEILQKLSLAKNKAEYTKMVLKLMDSDKKGTYTCVEYADWLQKIIDNILWIAYVDQEDESYKVAKRRLISTIDNEYKKYAELSNGIQYTLGEHIKLIKNCLMYIEWSMGSSQKGMFLSRLEDVRGGIIRNPVSRTVYYDYLGLSYHKKARAIIMDAIRKSGEKGEVSEREGKFYKIIDELSFDELSLSHIKILLDKSLDAFDKAREASSSDILWDGYIRYNRIRIVLLKYVLYKNESEITAEEISRELTLVKEIRENIKYLYTNGEEYLSECFDMGIDHIEELTSAYKDFEKVNS